MWLQKVQWIRADYCGLCKADVPINSGVLLVQVGLFKGFWQETPSIAFLDHVQMCFDLWWWSFKLHVWRARWAVHLFLSTCTRHFIMQGSLRAQTPPESHSDFQLCPKRTEISPDFHLHKIIIIFLQVGEHLATFTPDKLFLTPSCHWSVASSPH